MSSTFTRYGAVIPATFVGIPEAQRLIAFLSEKGLMRKEGQDVHFKVADCDESERYYLDDLPDDGDDAPPEAALLQQLIDTGKVCLVYESSWNSGGEDPMEEVPDVVALAETIPTLVLREILAKRLEG